jgi:hypothetical protein
LQVCVDDDVHAGEIEVLLAQWPEAGIEVGHCRVQLRYAGVDQHARSGMVDDVHVDRHPLALGEQVGNADAVIVIEAGALIVSAPRAARSRKPREPGGGL